MESSPPDVDAQRLRDSARFFDLAGDYLVVFGFDFRIRRVNNAVYRGLATTPAQVARRSIGSFIHSEDRLAALAAVDVARVNGRSTWSGRVLVGEGQFHWVQATLVHDVDEDTIVLVGKDVTAEHELTERLRHRAETDVLTGLWTRERFLVALEEARTERPLAVLFCDLDRFKVVNDSLGHAAGDELLRSLGRRLRAVHDDPRVAIGRIGGDEFVILLRDGNRGEAMQLAQRVRGLAAEPFQVNGRPVHVGMSVGIALSRPEEDRRAETLLGEADTAVYRAKAAGRGAVVVFDAEMREQAAVRLAQEADLRAALADNRLLAYAQPIVRIDDPSIVYGAELLVRMQMPDGSLRSPAGFLPVAEETGLISTIDELMLDVALSGLAARCETQLGVNISASRIVEPDFADSVIAAAERNGSDLSRLVIELTETSVLTDPGATMVNLSKLREHGVGVALDDFGTGYSSLAHLNEFPMDFVKIDRSFTSALPHDARTRAIVEGVLAMSNGLGLTVVAEGVETPQEAAALTALGCEEAQGWMFHRPMPLHDLERLMAPRSSAAA